MQHVTSVVRQDANRCSASAVEHKQASRKRVFPQLLLAQSGQRVDALAAIHGLDPSPESASAVQSESLGFPKRPARPTQVRRGRPFPLNAHLAAPPFQLDQAIRQTDRRGLSAVQQTPAVRRTERGAELRPGPSPLYPAPPDPPLPPTASTCHTPNAKPSPWGKPRAAEPIPPWRPTSPSESVSGRCARSASARNAEKPPAYCWEYRMTPWPSSVLLACAQILKRRKPDVSNYGQVKSRRLTEGTPFTAFTLQMASSPREVSLSTRVASTERRLGGGDLSGEVYELQP